MDDPHHSVPSRLYFRSFAQWWSATPRAGWLEYGFALAVTFLAFGLQEALGFRTQLQIQILQLHTHVELRGFVAFLVAIVLSALVGGIGPALLSTLLAAGLMARFLMPPSHSWQIAGQGYRWQWTTFIVSGLVCGILIELRHYKKQRRLASDRFQNATLASIGDAVITTDQLGNNTFLNREAEQLTGWKHHEAVGRPLGEVFMIINEETRQREEDTVRRVLRTGAATTPSGHTLLVSRDGREAPITESVAPIMHADGKLAGFVLVFRDETGSREARAELQKSLELQEQVTRIVNAAPAVIYSFRRRPDGTTCFPFASPELEEILGTSRAELVENGALAFSQVHPDDLPHVLATIDESARALSTWQCEFRATSSARGEIWLEARAIPEREADGGTLWHGFMNDITERKRSEQRLQLLNTALEAAANAVVLTDSSGLIVWVNAAFTAMTGYSAAEAIGQNPRILKSGVHPQSFYETMWNTVAEGHVWSGEVVNKRKDTTLYTEQMTITPVLNDRGVLKHFIAIKQDVTQHRMAEERLRASEANYRLLFDAASDEITVMDAHGHYLDANPAACRTLGFTREELLSRSITDCLDAENIPRFASFMEDLLVGKVATDEWRGHRKDGSLFICELHATRLTDGRMLGIGRDVTERKRAAQALLESEEKFRTLADLVPQMVWIATPDGRNIYSNQRCVEYTGMSWEESYGEGWGKRIHSDDVQATWDAWNQALATGEPGHIESRMRMADGSYRWFLTQWAPFRDASGKVVKWFGTSTDIDAMKQADEALRLSEERLRLAVRVAAMGIWELRFPTFTLIWSPEVRDIFGVPADAPQPGFEDAALFTHPDDRALVGKQIEHLIAGTPIQLDHRIIRPDGTVRWIEVTGKAEFDDSGQPVRCLGTIRDVTERHRLEQRFLQAQKMEAVGRLSGGVAHDFNNLLMVIGGYGDLLKEEVGSDERLGPMIEAILKASNRAASLTHQLLAFSRKQILMPTVIDLNSVLADLGNMLPRLVGEDIVLEIVPGNGLGRVMADASQIQQVVMNLAVNARDAMPDGGRLTIETANADWDETYGREYGIEAKPGSFVLLSVADNGIGMDRETQAHLFEPFFTTKDVDKGTGLGLSIVYGVVKQSGGFIWVASEPGQGTTFKIYLPRIEEKETTISETRISSKSHRGSETILLVEDEEGVREAISHFLRAQGYTVLEARNPSAAIEIAEQQRGPIHLLITDIIMPEMNGRELARQLAAIRPEMSALYISGYTDRAQTDGTTIDSAMNFLQKPFGFDVLGRKMRDILKR